MKSISYLQQQLAEAETCRNRAEKAMKLATGRPRAYAQERESYRFWQNAYYKIKGELDRRLQP